MQDMSSTAAFESAPAQRWRPLRGGLELAFVLRENLLVRECCRKKLAGVELHHQGKPLLALRFTDIVCCCGVPDQEPIARIARAHAHADDDNDISDSEQQGDAHEARAHDDAHDVGKGDIHEVHAGSDYEEGDTHGARLGFYDHDEGAGETHEAHADFGDDDDDDEMEADTETAHAGGDDGNDDDDDDEGEEDTHGAIHADYDENDNSEDGDGDEGEACTHEAHVDDDNTHDDDVEGEAKTHEGVLSRPQELLHTEANEPCECNKVQVLPLIRSHRQQPPTKQARCSKPFYHHGHGDVDDDRPHLPHDLLLDVLLRCLPLSQVISARAVCKAWHQALSSPRCFRLLVHNPDAARRYLVVQTSTPFDPSCLTFFDPARCCWPCTPIHLPLFPLFAAAGGLLCFGKNSSSASSNCVLLVGNPLTQQWRELPPVPTSVIGEHWRSPWCAMYADPLQACYKVFILHPFSDKMLIIYTYDSTTARWEGYKQEHREPDNLFNEGISTPKHTFNLSPNGSLLQVSCVEGRILSYNTVDRSFCVINIGSYPRLLDTFDLNINSAPYSRLPTLACCGEKFYLVGRVCTAANKVGGRLPFMLHGPVGIWELKVNSSGTHGDWVGPVTKADEDDLECAIAGSDGTDFYVTTDCQSTIYLFLTGGTTMLSYDVASHLWSSMPGCPAAHLLSLQGEAYYQPLLWPGCGVVWNPWTLEGFDEY